MVLGLNVALDLGYVLHSLALGFSVLLLEFAIKALLDLVALLVLLLRTVPLDHLKCLEQLLVTLVLSV